MRRYIAISLMASVIGVVIYGICNDYIIIRIPHTSRRFRTPTLSRQKHISIYWWNGQRQVRERVPVVWEHDHVSTMIRQVVALWLDFVKEEDLAPRHVGLESVALVRDGDRAYISFSDSPFTRDASMYDKWHLFESLLCTIRDLKSGIHEVELLVHHKSLHDEHLDCTVPWNIGGFDA